MALIPEGGIKSDNANKDKYIGFLPLRSAVTLASMSKLNKTVVNIY